MRYALILILICCLLLGGLLVQAQSGGYDLTWQTMDSGGGRGSGGTYRIHSTVGQPNAGETSGGDYGLQGGFWPITQAEDGLFFVYLPTVIK